MGNWGTGPCDWTSGINGFGPSEHKNDKYYTDWEKSGRLNAWRSA